MRPYLRVANVFEDRLDLRDIKEMHFSPEEYERYRLRRGDILLNEGQSPELVGRPAMYRGDPPHVCFTNSLIRFIPGEGVDGEYALLVFRRHLQAGRFQREARITTNIAHLSAGRLRSVEFPVPPLHEQYEIVQRVHRSLSLIADVETVVQRTMLRHAALRRAVLDRSFRGELTLQVPEDEPATMLLEQIAAEYATAENGKDRRKKALA
jgi:type I restriction enzyme S subunit